jgi:hypothetical protein
MLRAVDLSCLWQLKLSDKNVLGIDPAEELTVELVNHHYRKISRVFHPGRLPGG